MVPQEPGTREDLTIVKFASGERSSSSALAWCAIVRARQNQVESESEDEGGKRKVEDRCVSMGSFKEVPAGWYDTLRHRYRESGASS